MLWSLLISIWSLAPSCFHASRVEASLVSVDFVHVLGAELTMDLQLNIGLVS